MVDDSDRASIVTRLALSTSSMFASNLISALMGAVTLIVVARAIGPSGYAQFGSILAAAAFWAIFADFGINSLTVREVLARPDQAARIYWDAFRFRTVFGFASVAAFAVGAAVYYPASWLPGFALFAFSIYFSGIGSLVSTTFQVSDRFHSLARLRVIERAISSAFIIAGALIWGDLVHVAWFALIGTVLSSLMWLRFAPPKSFVGRWRDPIEWTLLPAAAWFGAAYLVSFLTGRVSVIVAGRILGTAAIGQYAVAFGLAEQLFLVAPSLLITLFPEMARRVRRGQVTMRVVGKTSMILFIIGAILAAGAALAADWAIPGLLGRSFSPAIGPFLVLMLSFPFVLATLPTSLWADATNNQKWHLVNGSYMAAIALVGALLLGAKFGPIGVAAGIAASRIVGCLVGVPLLMAVCQRAERQV